jgi:hypothetical protein
MNSIFLTFSLLKTGNGANICPLEELSNSTRLLYPHLSIASTAEKKLSMLVEDKIYMAQDLQKCIKHTVLHQKYSIGPYEDLYLHVLDASVARENAKADAAAGKKKRLIDRCFILKEPFNSYQGRLPIIETIALRKGKNGNWSDDDGKIIRIRKDNDMRSEVFEELNFVTGEWSNASIN